MDQRPQTSKSIHLSASAGSGKTRALKDRYLALLDVLDSRGLNIDQAVAITFTDKAAAEIKERVIRSLPEAMLKKIIRGRQDLRISTIHSFCMNLLKRYPLEAGLPPDFGVLDARDQAYKVQKAIEDALEESGRDRVLMSPLGAFTADALIETIAFLLAIRSRLKRMEIDAGGPDGLLRAVRSGMDIERTETALQALITGKEWRTSLRHMEDILRTQGDGYDVNRGKEHLALTDASDADAAFKLTGVLASVYFTNEGNPRKNPFITKKVYAGKNRDEYERSFYGVQALLEAFRSLFARLRAGQEAESLLILFQKAEKNYQNAKLREALLDFDDLEIYAYGLLQKIESTDILYWLDRKILHFLVDEFQDTSDIQWAILNKLTEELFAGQGADKRMPPTLFIVGDEKQSIYRFREANYRLIENVRQKMEKALLPDTREILTLDKNFRSTPEIIETANQVFTKLWVATYKPSEAVRKDHHGSVRLIELAQASEGGSEDLTEAKVLAREIRSLVTDRTRVYERSSGAPSRDNNGTDWTERAADYGDCAILIQSRTRLKEYEAALQEEGIPYRVIGGIGFYEEDEVQALMNVLFFLWNRDDRLALAAALKSPLFGLTDGDIFDLHAEGKDLLASLGALRPDAGSRLGRWTALAGLVPLSSLLHKIIEETGAYVRFGRNNPQAIFNIDKLLDTAREFDRRGYTTLQDFVEWVKNIRETEQREAAADMNLPGFQGSVSILTVHKAKGLEFPVVFLPGMNQQPKSITSGPQAIIEDVEGRLQMAVKDDTSPVYDDLWKREQEELLREHQRLLYVAMTRARDHLIMLGMLADGAKPIKSNTWLDYFHRTIPLSVPAGEEQRSSIMIRAYPHWDAAAVPEGSRIGRSARRQEQKPAIVPERETVLANLSPLERSETPEWKRATDFIHQGKEDSIEKLFLQAGAGAISPLTRGSLLHRCLEEFTKTGAYDLDRIVIDFPDFPTLGDDVRRTVVQDVDRVLGRVLTAEQFKWIFARKPGAYSELPFLYKRDNALVSGVIDRVVIHGGTGSVVDYKAILVENDQSLTSWEDHYRPQIQIYCEAVKHLFRLSKVEGYLLFLDSSRLALVATA